MAKEVCPEFEINSRNRELIGDIFNWCIQIEGRLALHKGLWLWGNVGTGKSTMLEIVLRFCRRVRPRGADGWPYGFRISRVADVCADFASKGYKGIATYIASRRQAFDEVGSETMPTSCFGTSENVVQYILQGRYDRRHEAFTHVTTNLRCEQIKDTYGARVYDRCREMFNFVEFSGATFRR